MNILDQRLLNCLIMSLLVTKLIRGEFMKKIFLFVLIVVLGQICFAESSKIDVKVFDLNNLAKGAALEACGMATHAEGKKPLLVKLTHDQSKYTTVTDESGNWCVVFKRWTNSGKITVEASTMDFTEKSNTTLR